MKAFAYTTTATLVVLVIALVIWVIWDSIGNCKLAKAKRLNKRTSELAIRIQQRYKAGLCTQCLHNTSAPIPELFDQEKGLVS